MATAGRRPTRAEEPPVLEEEVREQGELTREATVVTAAELYVDFVTAIQEEGRAIRDFVLATVAAATAQQTADLTTVVTDATAQQTADLTTVVTAATAQQTADLTTVVTDAAAQQTKDVTTLLIPIQ